jgi:hypothetical protein
LFTLACITADVNAPEADVGEPAPTDIMSAFECEIKALACEGDIHSKIGSFFTPLNSSFSNVFT